MNIPDMATTIGGAAVLVAMVKGIPAAYRKWRQTDRKIEAAEKVIAQADAVLAMAAMADAVVRVAEMATPLALVVHELSSNGGKSLKDTVNRLDAGFADLVIAQAEFRTELRAHRVVDHQIPPQRSPEE